MMGGGVGADAVRERCPGIVSAEASLAVVEYCRLFIKGKVDECMHPGLC